MATWLGGLQPEADPPVDAQLVFRHGVIVAEKTGSVSPPFPLAECRCLVKRKAQLRASTCRNKFLAAQKQPQCGQRNNC